MEKESEYAMVSPTRLSQSIFHLWTLAEALAMANGGGGGGRFLQAELFIRPEYWVKYKTP